MAFMEPENLLFICSDAHNYQKTGCYGDACAITPAIDSIADEGTLFENAYCNNPICVPSRASMITGEYCHKHHFWENAHPYDGTVEGFGHVLTKNKISVTTIGKLHFKDTKCDLGLPDQRLPLHVKDGRGDLYGALRLPQCRKPGLYEEIAAAHTGESDYTIFDRKVAGEACRYLKKEAPEKNGSWMLYVGFVCPHFPLIVPQEFYDLYADKPLPDPIQFSMEDRPHHPVLEMMRYYHGSTEADIETVRKIIRHYYGLISFMDAQVGKVLQALRESGLEGKTRVVYTSDHGDSAGDHGMFFKHNMFEGSVGVPLIMKGPGVEKGKRVQNPVSLLDIYPTVLDNFGIEGSRKGKDGRSLFEMAQDRDYERPIFSEYHGGGAITAEFMLRKGDYKLIYYPGFPSMLFNLKEDPDERTDLSRRPEYQNKLMECEAELRKICDPEKIHKQCRKEQLELIEQNGGVEKLLNSKNKMLYSPVAEK